MNKEHRKLMPMAAKAAGIRIEYEDDGSIAAYWNEYDEVWEPLHCNDDAMRLALKIRANITWDTDEITVFARDLETRGVFEHGPCNGNDDDYATLRMLLTKLAAELGERMP